MVQLCAVTVGLRVQELRHQKLSGHEAWEVSFLTTLPEIKIKFVNLH